MSETKQIAVDGATHELVSDGSGAARPGVILFPTVMGITDLERGFAGRLVGDGYSVLLADLYGRRFSPDQRSEAMAAMQAYDWPGNVRQLRNIVERTIILAPGDRIGRIETDMLPPELLRGPAGNGESGSTALMGAPLREARESFEREYLRVQIRRFSGNISRTASFIGMERSALHRKLKILGIAEARGDEEI